MSGLPTIWIRHLPSENHQSFEDAIRNSTVMTGRLRQIIQEELDALDRTEASDKQFEFPNWDYKQAFQNGQRSKLRFLLNILTFDQK